MNRRGLSFDSMPALGVPFRFFLTAPVFGVLAGLLLLLAEPSELSSRWSNLLLAVTHAVTLGFLLMVMFGALFQVMPVLLGVSMPKEKLTSALIHLCLVIGILCLVGGLYSTKPYLLTIAGGALALSFTLFFVAFISRIPAMRNTPSSWAIRLAVLSLLITTGLGLSFVAGWVDASWFPNFRDFTNIHLLWGLIGWTLLLVMAVSFQIIPMFYVTPDYPKWLCRYLPAIIFVELIFVSLSPSSPVVGKLSLITLTLTTSIYPLYTLYLISKRKRKSREATLWFWNTAMIIFLIAALMFLWLLFYNGVYLAKFELILATVSLLGFVMALITGMLLKIVPFLVWMNLQQSWIKNPTTKMPLSNMQQVIPNLQAKRQYWLFVLMLALIMTLMAGFQSLWLLKLTAVIMLANFGYLLYNLIKANRLYNRLAHELETNKSTQN